LTRSALAIPLYVALLVLTGCTVASPSAPASVGSRPPVDTECVGGLAFVSSYSGIAGRYDPQLETDRRQLAATQSLATARSLLADIGRVLDAYDLELRALRPPADFTDGMAGLLAADQRLRAGALALAGSAFGSADQATFQQLARDRESALNDLRLEVAFVTSECT
jgi:hypothetical protein